MTTDMAALVSAIALATEQLKRIADFLDWAKKEIQKEKQNETN